MSTPKRLFRNSSSGRIAGVCAGIADYFEADVTLIRLAWIVLSIVPGGLFGGVVAYLVAWMIMRDTDVAAPRTGARRLMRSMSDRKIGGVCGGLAEYFEVDPTAVRVLWAVLSIVPGGIVLGIVAYVVAWFIMPLNYGTQIEPASSPA